MHPIETLWRDGEVSIKGEKTLERVCDVSCASDWRLVKSGSSHETYTIYYILERLERLESSVREDVVKMVTSNPTPKTRFDAVADSCLSLSLSTLQFCSFLLTI